jgi:hypothetical protein
MHYMIPIAQTERILVATVNDVREIDDSPAVPRGAMNDSNPLMIAAVSGGVLCPDAAIPRNYTSRRHLRGVTIAPTQISTLHFSIARAPGFGASSYNASCH